jgi:hypothetical protein
MILEKVEKSFEFNETLEFDKLPTAEVECETGVWQTATTKG